MIHHLKVLDMNSLALQAFNTVEHCFIPCVFYLGRDLILAKNESYRACNLAMHAILLIVNE